MIPPCPRCGKDDFKKSRDQTNHLNRKHKCKPRNIQEDRINEPVSVTKSDVVPSSSQKETTQLSIEDLANWLANLEIKNNPSIISKKIPKTNAEWFNLIGRKAEISYQSEEDPEAGPGPATQVHRDVEQQDTISKESAQEDIIFKECPVGRDPEKPHRNRSLMSKWVGKIPHPDDNPTYAFIQPIAKPEEYKKLRPKIKEVLQTELHKKDQIKSAIVALCRYSIAKRKSDDTSEPTKVEKYHRGNMRPILLKEDIEEHITKTIGEIDVQIEETLKKGSGYILKLILEIYIETYTLRRALVGSYNPTPPKLANKKCTINPDNQGLIDPETNKPSEKCLQGALGAYFAYQNGHTDHLGQRIFRAKNLKPYLERVKLDGIPMPTPICPRIFNKIEEMNPDISINVWEWKEETATPKPVIASKNIYIPNSCKIENCKHNNPNKCQEKRTHVIHLMALTNITKTEEEKYGQKNHFLWIKNPNGLVFKDTVHHDEKHLCNRCFQSFPSENTLVHHQEHCFGLGEATQRVDLPVKGVNDFEQFKNYSRMINAPCVIIADFEAGNKKPSLINGGKPRLISEQYANSFCYLVHWIDTGDVWGPYLYQGENATQEFVQRIDQELIEINNVLAIKHKRIVTEEDKKKFAKADTCWICKGKFTIDTEEIERLESKKVTKAIASEKAKADKVWDHCHITGKFRGSAHRDCNLKLQIKPWKTPIPVFFHNFRGYDSHLVCESVGCSVNTHQIKVIAETFERYKSMKVGQLKYIDSQQFMNNSLANLTKNLGDDHPITSQHFKDFTPGQISLATHKGIYCYDYIDSQDRFLETELPPIHEFTTTLKGKISQEDYHHAQKVWKTYGCKNLGEYHDLYLKIDVLSLADVWTQFQKTCIKYYELDPSHYVSAPSLSWDAMLKKTGVKIELFTDMSMHDFIEKAKRGGISKASVENVTVGKDWLSPYNEELVNNLDGGRFSKTEKLVPHLGPRKDYVIHYLKLQYYVKLGMVVDEVSEILSFDQTNWLAPYIAFNTEKRQGLRIPLKKTSSSS
ncbi:hypothetical protein RclHR1_16860003 [Rhizophagus clarus]|uniref:DNA-directed DNA polymerase n=1 Tax=Rhizophagus clarus TaxID=94130 RepID=A0A2Z6QZ61_9GLOM|nr:hypothetical protein RclHR1_16860003 [Rhizophagus clarus]